MCFHNAKRGRSAVVTLGLCKSGVAGSYLASATALQIKSPKGESYNEWPRARECTMGLMPPVARCPFQVHPAPFAVPNHTPSFANPGGAASGTIGEEEEGD
jgi:hypothetical protein